VDMVELDIEMDSNLAARAHDLAQRYFGNDSEESMAQVLELAFRMRSLWGHSIMSGQQDTDEAVSNWESPESSEKRDNNGIQNWLFRR
jgi:hypothetical protein